MKIELHLLDMKYDHLKIRNVREEKRLVGSLAACGQVTPVIVVASCEQAGHYVLIDGFKRVRGVGKVGGDVVEADVWEHSETEALVRVYLLQQPRERSALEDAYLVQVLLDEEGLVQVEVAQRLGRTTSWVSRRLGLLGQLPDSLQEQVRTGALQCYAATKYLVPLARANRDDAERLARSISGLRLSTREIGELYAAWRESDEAGRELVVTRPVLALEARRVAREPLDASAGDAAQLLQDLERIISLAQRSRHHLDRLLLGTIDVGVGEHVGRVWHRVESSVSVLATRLQKEVLDHARRGQEKRDTDAESPGLWRAADCESIEDLPHGCAQSASRRRRGGPPTGAREQG